MALSVQAVVLLTPGRNEFLIDTPPVGCKGTSFRLDNSLWLPGTTCDVEIFYSYDGGLSFPNGVSSQFTQGGPIPVLGAGIWHTAAQQAIDGVGFVQPTHARATATLNALASVSTGITLGWVGV